MDALLVGLIALAAIVLFVREVWPADVVAILVLCTLATLQLVTPREALSGFSNEATIAVGAMFVLSAGLRETGALDRIGRALVRVGRNGPLLLLATVLVSAAVSAFINNTAAVAVFLPIVLAAARSRGVAPSKLLIPLSFASQFGGVCTLMGTSTNLLVNSLVVDAGLPGFAVFDFAPIGLLLVGVGTLYLLAIGWFLLPTLRSRGSLEDSYSLHDYLAAFTVLPDSKSVGRAVGAIDRAQRGAAALVEVIRGEQRLLAQPDLVLQAGDVLLAEGSAEALFDLSRLASLRMEQQDRGVEGGDLQLVELVVSPHSRLIGRTLAARTSELVARGTALAIGSRGRVRHGDIASTPLSAGDVLLLLVRSEDVASLREDPDVIVLSERADPVGRTRRAPLAIAIVATVVAVATTGLMPIATAALIGAAVMVTTRCLPVERAYRAVELRVLVLLAAMLPLGLALQKTGAAREIVGAMLATMPSNDPLLALAIIYGATALLTEVISNNATGVLMTPIAIALASQLGVSALPLVAAVAFAASTSFSTPIGYQTNAMVYNAGGYRFRDFVRVGLPLNLLFWAVSVYAIPRVFPF